MQHSYLFRVFIAGISFVVTFHTWLMLVSFQVIPIVAPLQLLSSAATLSVAAGNEVMETIKLQKHMIPRILFYFL